MKTAISVPDDVFVDAERLAKRMKTSRSEIYSRAMREFVARHADDRVTEALDDVIAGTEEARDEFASESARRSLKRVAW